MKNKKQIYWYIYISDKKEFSEIEVARFTSKGMMFICLPEIQKLYKDTEFQVLWTHEFIA